MFVTFVTKILAIRTTTHRHCSSPLHMFRKILNPTRSLHISFAVHNRGLLSNMSAAKRKVKSAVDREKKEDLNLVKVPTNDDDHGILGGKRQAAPLILEKALKILKILDSLYPDPPVPLNHVNDFTFLVAVVLSAQTTDGKVNEVTKELFALADTPQKMMQLSVEEVLRIIRPLGLSAKKAVFVVELSKKLVEDFGGVVPSSFEALESLPGVGHKTASVIRSQCFGIAAFAVDTHVHRLALRWGLSKEQKNVEKVQADLCAAFPEYSWHKVYNMRNFLSGLS